MVAAGEAGGILDTIFQRLSIYIEKAVKLKAAMKSAMVYPAAIVFIASAVITLILWKVVPTFTTLFNSMEVELPLPTRIVIMASSFVGNFGIFILIGLGIFAYLFKAYYGTPKGRYNVDKMILKLPVFRPPRPKNLRGPFYPDHGDSDLERSADSRGAGHHRTYFG